MKKKMNFNKSLILGTILLLTGVLVACAVAQQGPGGQPSAGMQGGPRNSGAASGQSEGAAQSASLPLESKIGIGILKLEGTGQSIDKSKAGELLPLFKALKVLSTNNNTAVDEIRAINTQIKNTMSADQLASIEDMNITNADLRTLMETYGLNQSTASSGTSSSSGQGGFGGPPDGGMMMMAGGATSGNRTTTQATPNAIASMANARKAAGGLNLTFVDPVIKLLNSKIVE